MNEHMNSGIIALSVGFVLFIVEAVIGFSHVWSNISINTKVGGWLLYAGPITASLIIFGSVLIGIGFGRIIFIKKENLSNNIENF
jgi:hypothetical protein